MVFPVVMYGCESWTEESWVPKNWCFWTVVLEKTLESPLDCKEIQPVHPKRDQSWVFIGRTDFEAETPILWPPHVKSWLIGKDPDAGRDWGQQEKGMTENEMAEWHQRLNGHEFEWTPGVGDGQGGLVCWDSWGRKESDTTEWLNRTELIFCVSLNHFYYYWEVSIDKKRMCWVRRRKMLSGWVSRKKTCSSMSSRGTCSLECKSWEISCCWDLEHASGSRVWCGHKQKPFVLLHCPPL